MCQYDVSHHISPCNTFIYYLTHLCRRAKGPGHRCMVVNLRQKHVRQGSPCGHPSVCDWCRYMPFGDGGELWNEAKSTPYGYGAEAVAGFPPLIIDPAGLPIPIPTIPAQLVQTGSGVGAGPVEYDGTTYYVSPEEFQRRIWPEIQERKRKKAAKRHLSMLEAANRTPTIGESMIAVTSSTSPQPLEITAPVRVGTTHCFNPEAKEYQPTQHALEERGLLSFQALPYSQWKFYEGPAQQGKPMMVVSFGPLPDLNGGTTAPYYTQDLRNYNYIQPQWSADWGYFQPTY
jgi:hypothetical protein